MKCCSVFVYIKISMVSLFSWFCIGLSNPIGLYCAFWAHVRRRHFTHTLLQYFTLHQLA